MSRGLAVAACVVMPFWGIAGLHLGIEPSTITAAPSRHIYLDTVGTRSRVEFFG